MLRVCDNGPGIPAASRDAVFRPFFRLEASRTTPGTGLGLSLVAAIAALHGARVTLADNNPGLCVRIAFAAPEPEALREEHEWLLRASSFARYLLPEPRASQVVRALRQAAAWGAHFAARLRKHGRA